MAKIVWLTILSGFAIAVATLLWKNVWTGLINLLLALVIVGLAIYLVCWQRRTVAVAAVDPVRGKWRRRFIFGAIVGVAVLVRVVGFATVPAGLNVDEASMLYEAYALLKYGIDRNGTSFPVYLEAWGGGQNALLTYLTIPFVAMFGLRVFTARIVSLLFSFVSMFVFYYLMQKLTGNKNIALVGFALFALCPYNIMIARWGLESNLFPHFLLYGITFLVKTYQDHPAYIFPACLLLGIGLYNYAIAYLVVPLLLVGVYVYFITQKKINRANCWMFVTANALLLVCALPLILFLLVNYGWLPEIHIGAVTIPKLRDWRGGEVSFRNIPGNLNDLLVIVLGQSDTWLHNSPFNLGILYVVSTPFFVFGICRTMRRLYRKQGTFTDFLLCWWLVVSLAVALLLRYPNINKMNALWFVLLIFTTLGVVDFAQGSRVVMTGLALCLVVGLVTFCGVYFTTYNTANGRNFQDGLMDGIAYAKTVADPDQPIYFAANLHEPYIFCLIVDGQSPDEFLQTREFSDPKTVTRYGRYEFLQTIETLEPGQIYVMQRSEFDAKFGDAVPADACHVFTNFVVVTA